jgi:hypothetical protein
MPRYLDSSLFMLDGQGATPWYESPDIVIDGSNEAVANVDNNLTAHPRMHPAGDFNGTRARLQVYCCEPGLATPNDPRYAALIHDSINLSGTDPNFAKLGKTALKTAGDPGTDYKFKWHFTPDTGMPPQVPALAIGHKCLIARIYADADSGSAPNDFLISDDHEVQHNIETVLVATQLASELEEADAAGAGMPAAGLVQTKPLGLNKEGLFEFRVNTTAIGKRPEEVTLRATWVNPTPARAKRLVPILKRTHAFKGFARQRPRKFALHFGTPRGQLPPPKERPPDVVKAHKTTDHTHVKGKPTFEAKVKLRPNRVARFGLTADLRNTRVGLAHVFALEQFGPKGHRDGGLTVIFLRVR